jgi:hypothetical protein
MLWNANVQTDVPKMERSAAGVVVSDTRIGAGAHDVLFPDWDCLGGALKGTVAFDGTRLRQISRHRRCPKSEGRAERKNCSRKYVRALNVSPDDLIISEGRRSLVAGNRRVAVETKELKRGQTFAARSASDTRTGFSVNEKQRNNMASCVV